MGQVNFNKMVVERETEDGLQFETAIKRTETNKRERPDADDRFGSNQEVSRESRDLNLYNFKDFEWIAWNYRAWINQTKYSSRKTMVFNHFNIS